MKEKSLLLKKTTSIALLALMMALLAPLAAKAQTVLYEGFDGTTIPLGWERYEGRLHPYWLDDNPNDPEYGTDALTPTNTGWIFGKPYCTSNYNLNHVYFNIYGTDRYFWLVSPTVAIGNNVQLCFDVFYNRYSSCSQPALSGGEDDRFVVVVTSDGDNRWHIVRQWDNNPEPELASGYVLDDFPVYPTRVCLDLSDYAGQNITLAFYAESRISNTDNMLHIDNVSIEYYSACTAPTYLAASDITANSAVLDWYSDADAWQIMLNGDETNLIDVAEIPYTLSGLTPASEYQVSVRSVCGGTTSEWSDDILTFYTACVPIATLPWIENFDSYTPSSSSTNAPESNYVLGPQCWNYYVMNGNYGTSAQYPQIFISSVSTYAVSDNCLLFKTNDTYPIYAMLPEFTDNISDLQLTFTYRSSNVVKVGYVPSLSGWFDDIESYFVPVQTCGTTSTLTEQQVLFTDAPSGSMMVFKIEHGTSNGSITSLDNIIVDYSNSSTCPVPPTPTIVVGSSGAMPTLGASYAWLTWSFDGSDGVEGWQLCVNGDEDNLIEETDTVYYLNGLTPETEYTVKVRSNCGDDHYSDWSGELTFTTLACPVPPTPRIYYENSEMPLGMTFAELTWWDELIDMESYQLCLNDNEDWEYLIDVTDTQYYLEDLTPGTEYTVKVRSNCGDGYYSDWSGELTFTTLTCPEPSTPWIREADEFDLLGATYAAIGWWIEFETDVDVEEWQLCVNGDEDNLIDVTDTDYYLIEYYLENLTPETEYTVKVRSYCGNGYYSDWSGELTFTTDACPVLSAPLINYLDSEIPLGMTYAYLVWDSYYYYVPDYAPDAWQLCVNNDEDNLIDVTDTEYYLEDLTPGTEYTVKVRTNCGDENYSEWSEELTFTTLACPVPPTPIVGGGEKDGEYLGKTYANIWWGSGFEFSENVESYQLYLNGYEGCEYIDVTGTEYYLEDLTPGTEYTVNIRSNCGDGYYSEWSEDLTFTTLARTFEMNGNWNVADNWNPNGVPTEGENVSLCAQAVIPEGYTANVGEITIESESEGSLTIANGGQLIHTNEGVSATVEKAINGYSGTRDNYYLISTPVYSQTYYNYLGTYIVSPYNVENMLSNGYDLYDFDFTEENEWINHKQDGFMLEKTHSYLYANSQDVTLRFTGILSHATMDLNCITDYLPYSEGNYAFANWRLFGNPYPCNAYVGLYDVLNETVSYDHYEMNEDGNDFIYSNAALLPMEGAFYIVGAANRYKLVAIAEASNIGGKSVGSSLNLNLRNDGKLIDAARIRFGEGNGMPKLQLNPSHTKVVIPRDGKDYAVAYSETGVGEMPVSFKAEANGTYTLDFSNEEVTFNYLHLIDNLTGNEVDLLQTPTYTFEAKTTDYASRFKLVFAVGSSTGSDTFAFYSNGSYVINNEGRATLQVVDVMGRIIKSETINGCANVNVDVAPGVYMLCLVNGENVKVQKVVVR